jgi:hypothetical protein
VYRSSWPALIHDEWRVGFSPGSASSEILSATDRTPAAVKALRSSPSTIWNERGFAAAVFGGIVQIQKGYSLESISWLPAQPKR